MTDATAEHCEPIIGSVEVPSQWTVFAPVDRDAPADTLREIPATFAGVKPSSVTATRCQYDFSLFFGDPPYDAPRAAIALLTLHAESEVQITLGLGADYYMQAWMNGRLIHDTMTLGNITSPPTIKDFRVVAKLNEGENLLAVRFVTGKGPGVLAIGGPNDLRRGDFESIMPKPEPADLPALRRQYPPDPEATIQWTVPSGFDPRIDGLGLTPLREAEHMELLHAVPSRSAETGCYESLQHGSWNHNITVTTFRNSLIAVWDNHALDENGPGSRIIARMGIARNDDGDMDWAELVEIAPQAVAVRRRPQVSDSDAVRGAQPKGRFRVIDDRLFFDGHVTAIFGMTSDPDYALWSGCAGSGQLVPADKFHFGPGPEARRGGYIHWDLGVRFFQEWTITDGKLQAASPIYLKNDLPGHLPITPELTLPLERWLSPYRDAPLLADAPPDFQSCVNTPHPESTRYAPGTRLLAHDGLNGLAHSAEFRRPDGTWAAIRENQTPRVQPFYYAAEISDGAMFYPPARRTTLYGAVRPAAGVLPDGRVYIVSNSPNRQNMFITVSRDGRTFGNTRLLMHKRLPDYTPGVMKQEGGPGGGPQYFAPAVVGRSLWLIYSISKEHIGATRIPIDCL